MRTKVSDAPPPPAPSLDEGIIMTFLSGEMCLRGVCGHVHWMLFLCVLYGGLRSVFKVITIIIVSAVVCDCEISLFGCPVSDQL